MISSTPEAMHRIFREHPEVVGVAFRKLGFDFPETSSTCVLHADLAEVKTLERQADMVLRVDAESGGAFLLVLEAQREPEDGKLRSWPCYLACLHERHELPVVLVVICQDRATAAWAQKTVSIGTGFWTGMTVQPLVLGPHNVPFPAGRISWKNLPLAVLATIAHAREPGVGGVLEELAAALSETDKVTQTDLAVLTQLGLAGLPAGKTWRNLMPFTIPQLRRSPELRELLDAAETTARAQARDEGLEKGRADGLAKGRSEGRAKGLAEGRAEGRVEGRLEGRAAGLAEGRAEGRAEGLAIGRAADILRILDRRGVRLTVAERGRISGCIDMRTLELWLDAALDADTAGRLFK
jgi:hypothetical protein